MIRAILYLLVVFSTNVIQGITGFAGTVLAMPFTILLYGIDVAKPSLPPWPASSSQPGTSATLRGGNSSKSSS